MYGSLASSTIAAGIYTAYTDSGNSISSTLVAVRGHYSSDVGVTAVAHVIKYMTYIYSVRSSR